MTMVQVPKGTAVSTQDQHLLLVAFNGVVKDRFSTKSEA